MMQVYINAMECSKGFNKTQYVIAKGLDIFYCSYGKELLSYLKDGYEIKDKFNNGISERKWRVDDPNIIDCILKIAGCNLEYDFLYINTQEFYEHNVSETVYMYFDVWNKNHPTTVYITLKSIYDPEYIKGQKNARSILDMLFIWNVKQDKDSIIDLLEKEQCIKK